MIKTIGEWKSPTGRTGFEITVPDSQDWLGQLAQLAENGQRPLTTRDIARILTTEDNVSTLDRLAINTASAFLVNKEYAPIFALNGSHSVQVKTGRDHKIVGRGKREDGSHSPGMFTGQDIFFNGPEEIAEGHAKRRHTELPEKVVNVYEEQAERDMEIAKPEERAITYFSERDMKTIQTHGGIPTKELYDSDVARTAFGRWTTRVRDYLQERGIDLFEVRLPEARGGRDIVAPIKMGEAAEGAFPGELHAHEYSLADPRATAVGVKEGFLGVKRTYGSVQGAVDCKE
ncbi:hypothetical protein CMI48_00320 [Candidatus Pacearchaeota archaeon]|jgi:hypothetical protein|nr:hypothetical protein [Candidatus Pacearchaeota archaeon]|tara:strand:+ start:468 stop:1331 length:864 start_codon:yes stop_codon:yes gene_type:complete